MQQIKNKIPFGRIIFTKELIVSIFLFTILPCAYGQEKISEKVAEIHISIKN